MRWKVVWRDARGEERCALTPSLEAALIQADYDQTHRHEVLRIEGPNGEITSADEIRKWGRRAHRGEFWRVS